MFSIVYWLRRLLNAVSVGLGGEASTTGRAGLTIRPPTVTDSGGVGVAAAILMFLLGLDGGMEGMLTTVPYSY